MRIIRQSTRGIRYISQFGLSLSQNNNPNQLNWCCDLWLWFEIKRSKCGWCCCVPPAVVLTLTNVVVSFYVLLLRGNSGSSLNVSHPFSTISNSLSNQDGGGCWAEKINISWDTPLCFQVEEYKFSNVDYSFSRKAKFLKNLNGKYN